MTIYERTNDGMPDIPLFTTSKASGAFIYRCYEENKPVIWMNQIRGWKWCFVIVNMESTSTGGNPEDFDILTEAAVEQINEICEKYEPIVRAAEKRVSIGSMSTRYGASYMTFPDMKPPDAEAFAGELAEIVLDAENHETRDMFLD